MAPKTAKLLAICKTVSGTAGTTYLRVTSGQFLLKQILDCLKYSLSYKDSKKVYVTEEPKFLCLRNHVVIGFFVKTSLEIGPNFLFL